LVSEGVDSLPLQLSRWVDEGCVCLASRKRENCLNTKGFV
jgi:hypothetical protein